MRPAVSDQPVSNLNVSPRRRPPARAAPRRARRHRGPARLDPARRGGRLRAPLAPRAGDARGGDRRWPYAAGPRPEADVMRRRLAVAAFLALPAVAWAQERKTLAECIEIALRQQPTLRAAAATVAAGRERVWQAAATERHHEHTGTRPGIPRRARDNPHAPPATAHTTCRHRRRRGPCRRR